MKQLDRVMGFQFNGIAGRHVWKCQDSSGHFLFWSSAHLQNSLHLYDAFIT